MSFSPKIDEISHSVLQTDFDFASFTETWLTDLVHDNVIQIPGYNFIRKDRSIGHHGGVWLYIKESIPFEIHSQYRSDQFELRCSVGQGPPIHIAERRITHYHWYNLPLTIYE